MVSYFPLNPKYINDSNIRNNGGYLSNQWNNGSRGHYGLDYKAPKGSDVYALENGKVIYSGYNKDYGNYIIIQHSYGTSSLYAHFRDKPLFKLDDKVNAGTKIGEVGKTGNTAGKDISPHLYYERLDKEGTDSVRKNSKLWEEKELENWFRER